MKRIQAHTCMVAVTALLLALLALLAVPAAAIEATLDYGKNNDTDRVISPSALFDLLFAEEEPLTAGERAALDAMSEAALRYNGGIPDTVIERIYNGDVGELTVLVSPYRYTATNGETVEWIPTTVSVNGGERRDLVFSEEQGRYLCVFTDLWHSEDLELEVDFLWQTEISADTADGLLTLPYAIGSETLAALMEYEAAAKVYADAERAHKAYLLEKQAHDTASKAFSDYQLASTLYWQQKDARNAYLKEKAEFDARVQAYREYLDKKQAYADAEKKYYDFEAFRAEHAALYDRYELYLMGLEEALLRLSIMESMFVYDSHYWQFYAGVMGGTVDSVLAQSHLLETTLFVERKYIDNAKAATVALRPLLKGYADLRSATYTGSLERYRALFGYYSENYEAIRDQIILLYESLYAIYSNSGVSAAMSTHPETKPKVAHFQQFLAQLYVIRCALEDGRAVDPAWRVSPHIDLSAETLVEEALRVDLGSKASPAGVTLPESEVVLPGEDFPEPVEKPVKDFEDLTDPTLEGEPSEVEDPGDPPAVVADPGDPPAVVLPPEGDAPEAPALTPAQLLLAEELRAGLLPLRAPKGCAQQLAITERVSCRRSISNRKTVTYYGLDGKRLETVTVEYGAAAPQPDMAIEDDERYSYVFLGWVLYGEPDTAPRVELHSVTEDLSLSPVYRKTERLYEVVWEVNGLKQTEYYPYGAMPVCPLSTDRPSDSSRYTFLGWSSPLVPVAGAAVYVAQYEVSPLGFTVTWIVNGVSYDEFYPYGSMPTCPVSTDRAPDSHVYRFTGWSNLIRPATEDATYVAVYASTPLAVYQNGGVCPVEHTAEAVILLPERDVVDLYEASLYAQSAGKLLCLSRNGFTVSFTVAEQQSLLNEFVRKLEWCMAEGDTPQACLFSFRYLTSAGSELAISMQLRVRTKLELRDGMYPMAYQLVGEKRQEAAVTRYADGSVELLVSRGVQILFRPEYRLQYTDPTENCNLTALAPHAPMGSTVLLDANCTFGYEIVGAVLTMADGSRQRIEGKHFEMPAEALRVEVLVERIVYHVTFVSDGAVIFETQVFFGEPIPVPADPVKAEDADFTYAFEGWTPYVMNATGEDRSPVFTASFSRTAKVQVSIGGEDAKDRFLTVMVPLMIASLIFVGVSMFLCVRYRRELRVILQRAWNWLAPRVKALIDRLVPCVKTLIGKLGQLIKRSRR